MCAPLPAAFKSTNLTSTTSSCIPFNQKTTVAQHSETLPLGQYSSQSPLLATPQHQCSNCASMNTSSNKSQQDIVNDITRPHLNVGKVDGHFVPSPGFLQRFLLNSLVEAMDTSHPTFPCSLYEYGFSHEITSRSHSPQSATMIGNVCPCRAQYRSSQACSKIRCKEKRQGQPTKGAQFNPRPLHG